MGERRSLGLTQSLLKHDFVVNRLKTGTPPRAYTDSINWNQLNVADGESNPLPFSMFTPKPYKPKNIPCYLAYTTKKTHQIIKNNIHLSTLHGTSGSPERSLKYHKGFWNACSRAGTT